MSDFENKLREAFNAHANLSGKIHVNSLKQLCLQLNLEVSRFDFENFPYRSGRDSIDFEEFSKYFYKIIAESPNNPPSREVSPRYVFGKKYGRRSRPESGELDPDCRGELNFNVDEMGDIKKRRTCEPPEKNAPTAVDPENNDEEMLVAAWAAVASEKGTLSKSELVDVFIRVGLECGSEEAASSVFEKLGLIDNGLTLDALLYFVRNGCAGASSKAETEFQDYSVMSETLEFTSHSPGFISGEDLLEMWESAGVPEPHVLLHKLGYRVSEKCDLALLSSRCGSLLHENGSQKAICIIQKTYSDSLKMMVEQLNGANEKLRCDLQDANQRAQLLAQEIDEHHSRLEAAAVNKVKSLEQRHTEKIRELTEQMKADHDHLSELAGKLENRVQELEMEGDMVKPEIMRLREEYSMLQDEYQTVVNQFTQLKEEKVQMLAEVSKMNELKSKIEELEHGMQDRDVYNLLDKIRFLELENKNLKDSNDELVLQAEALTIKFDSMSTNANKTYSLETSLNEDMMGVNSFSANSTVESEIMDENFMTLEMNKSVNTDLKLTIAARIPELAGKTDDELISLLLSKTACLSCKQLKTENNTLQDRCNELEKSLEQLQDVYEKTEEYWSSKLEEERNLFEAEQKQSDDKYSELVGKILEYEDAMKEEASNARRLDTIEERDYLEKQVMEIEEGYEKMLQLKEMEIQTLRDKLNIAVSCERQSEGTQTDEHPTFKFRETVYNVPCKRSLTFSSGDRRRHHRIQNRYVSEISTLQETKANLCQELADLVAERDLLYKEVLSRRREVHSGNSLYGRIHTAERRCKALESALNQQRIYTEEILRKTCNQHKKELRDLRAVLTTTEEKLHYQTSVIQQQLAKLAASDGYMKDLFVENSHLLAEVRRLEDPAGYGPVPFRNEVVISKEMEDLNLCNSMDVL